MHTSKDSADYLADLALLALESAEAIPDSDITKSARERLHTATENFPRAVRIFHHHMIQPEDKFAMQPGFENFSKNKVQQRR